MTLKLRAVSQKRARLYEDFADGILSEEEYAYAKTSFDGRWEALNRQLDELTARRTKYSETMSGENRWIKQMKSVEVTDTLTQAIEKQFIVENMHEAIVSREEYDLAQAVIRKTGRSPAKASYYPLRSLVRCGNCGRCMAFLKSGKGFYCTYGRTDRNSACPTEAIHLAADIEQRIYDAIMLFLKAADEKGNLSDKFLKKKKSEIQKNMDMLTDFQKQCGKLKKQKLKSYEEYSGGVMTKQAYLDDKRIIDEKLRTIENSIDAAKQRIADLESLEESEPQTSQFDRFLNEPSLTYEMAHAFVEAVYIYPDGTNEICWKFKDFTEGNLTGINQT